MMKAKPKPSKAFDTYWKFAVKRQEAFFSKLSNSVGPWTDDPIISEYKFTNCYRASDRVSQYLIKNVIYSKRWSLKDTVFRTLLFKLFNKIETWELLTSQVGEISTKTFDPSLYGKILDRALASKASIYSAAYIIPSGPKKKYLGLRKHTFHLQLLQNLIKDNFHNGIAKANSMEEAYSHLLAIESFGRFLAYQYVTDLNYSEHFHYGEDEFVVPGPGAQDGIRKCFSDLGGYSESDIIRMVFEEQEFHFDRLGYTFRSLWGRPLQLIDCQNLFCEVDKYSRVAHPDIMGISGRTRIKQKFKPNFNPLEVWYPPKWGLNDKIQSTPYLAAETA